MSRALLLLNLLAATAIVSTHSSALLAAISPYRSGADAAPRPETVTTSSGASTPELRMTSVSCPIPPLDVTD